MNTQYLLAIVIVGLGLRFLFRGYAAKSKPRIVAGVSIMIVGASQFFRQHSSAAITIIAIGFALFVFSLYMMKMEHGRIMRPNERKDRR